MIVQPERGTRGENEFFYKREARIIAALNEVFGDVNLTEAEKQTLIWLAKWEDSTVLSVISAVQKAIDQKAKQRKRSAPSAGREAVR